MLADTSEIDQASTLWDRYWFSLASTGLDSEMVKPFDSLKPTVKDISNWSAADMVVRPILVDRATNAAYPAFVYIPGKHVSGKRVVETGIGYGGLSRCLAPFASRYLGIEISKVALSFARSAAQGAMQKKVRFVHVTEKLLLDDLAGTFDVALSRNVIRHCNFSHAARLLQQQARMLKRGGLLACEFSLLSPEAYPNAVFPASSQLALNVGVSAAYYFSDAAINALAGALDLLIEDMHLRPDLDNTRFVLFRKP